MAILEVQDIQAGYQGVQILWGASLALEALQVTCLVGANGAGKTTLLRAIMGQVRPWQGAVRFEGREISAGPAYAKAELGLALVPEGRQLFAGMSVLENLELGATPRRARPNYRRNLGRVFQMFPRLYERRNQKAGTLSGGEQQMLAVGRGMMAEPKVLMLDELSLGLAPVLALQLFEALTQLKQLGITLLLVEQNVQMALAISDTAYMIAHGKIVQQGPSHELLRDESIRAAYLGL